MARALNCSALTFVLVFASSAALAHDLCINRGGYENPAGEWCCGTEDGGGVSPNGVKATKGGYSVASIVTYSEAITGNALDGPTMRKRCTTSSPTASLCLRPMAPIGAASDQTVRRAFSSLRQRVAKSGNAASD